MIRTMLVEDERVLLEDLLTIVDWKSEGFEIVSTAANGKQGFKKYEQYLPELIISDIKMPVMDGLTMLKSIKHKNPNVHFIILSAYNEFEYAKDALRLGAEDYILKTEISRQYLTEKLRAIKKSMAAENNLLFAAAEKLLLDIAAAPKEASKQKLTDILEPLEALHDPDVLPRILEYLLPVIQKHYEDMKVPDKYEPPEIISFLGLSEWLLDELEDISHLRELIFTKQYSPVIVNSVEYIKKSFSNPELKINMIAGHVGISSGRLSVLFKKEMELTINDFITKVRMEEAKKLLNSGKYKVYEVSDLVGYKTSQYFSQIFFQYTGQYPNQYRRGMES